MQFTGLLDNNKTKIFEGDIVNRNILPLKGENQQGEIKFINGCFCIVMEDGTRYLLNDKNYFVEVIGNIFETPELLEKDGRR